jgi:hypothetical protein
VEQEVGAALKSRPHEIEAADKMSSIFSAETLLRFSGDR